jgi:hypothetical protein
MLANVSSILRELKKEKIFVKKLVQMSIFSVLFLDAMSNKNRIEADKDSLLI